MELKEKSSAFRRNFGFTKVEWKIENYFTETCKKKWIIYSPEFSVRGPQSTKWRLCLRVRNIDRKCTVWIYLARSEHDSVPYEVQVNWRVFYPCGADNRVTSQATSNFENKSTVGMEIYDFQTLQRNMQSISCNTLVLRCLMIVYKQDSRPFKRSKLPGIKSLSQDMTVAYRLKKHSDMSLYIGSSPISVHKAVLSCRNRLLKADIDRKNCRIDFPCLDFEAAKNVFAYFYTGNLDYVLRTPSLSIQQCISYFSIDELEDFYRYDELTLWTKFGVREYNFRWIINDINSSTETRISSSLLTVKGLDTVIRLHLYTEGFNANSNYMSILVEAVDVDWPEWVILEIAVENTKGIPKFCQRRRWTTEDGKTMVFENCVPRDILENGNFVRCGMLCVVCGIQVPTSSQSQFVIKSKTRCGVPTAENHYELLSNQVSRLFKTGEYSDFTIVCGETKFKVHKFILSSRSHVFHEIISHVENEGSICITDIEPSILSIVLHYLYSGILEKCELDDIFKIYTAAESFFILPLKYTCSDILHTKIEMSNVLKILNVAQTSKDYKLKISTFKFICKNLETAVKEIADYPITLNEHFIKDFIRFLRHNSNLNPSLKRSISATTNNL